MWNNFCHENMYKVIQFYYKKCIIEIIYKKLNYLSTYVNDKISTAAILYYFVAFRVAFPACSRRASLPSPFSYTASFYFSFS